MKDNQCIVAIIPARGGSKSIPRKNIRLLDSVPLIAYSIEAAKRSRLVDRVIVSTDDKAIAEVAREWGAETPFLRPAELAGDAVTDLPVFEHAVRWLEFQENCRPDIVVQVRPTSPLRPPGLIDEAIETLFARPDADSVRTVTPAGENPFKMWQVENGTLKPLLVTASEEPYNLPRQVLPDTFWQTGHVEAIRYRTIIGKRSLTGDVILPCLVPHEYAIDLDNLRQWDFADYVLNHWDLELVRPCKMPVPEPVFDFFKMPS